MVFLGLLGKPERQMQGLVQPHIIKAGDNKKPPPGRIFYRPGSYRHTSLVHQYRQLPFNSLAKTVFHSSPLSQTFVFWRILVRPVHAPFISVYSLISLILINK
jgi:hypothetical protein